MAYKPLPLTDPQRRHKPDAKNSKLAAVGEKDAKHEDLEQMFLRVLKKGLEEFAGPRAESSGKNPPPGPRRGRSYQASVRHGTKKSPEPKTEKAPSSQSNSAPPASTGAEDPKEPRPPIKCYSCGLPGFILPELFGKRQEGRVDGIAPAPLQQERFRKAKRA